MRSLQHCDFCDEEAVGTFETVPPELDPTDAERRRVLLCTDCEARLETLLEPLFARLGVDGADGPAGEAAASRTDASATDRVDRDPADEATDSDGETGISVDAAADGRKPVEDGTEGDGSGVDGETAVEPDDAGDASADQSTDSPDGPGDSAGESSRASDVSGGTPDESKDSTDEAGDGGDGGTGDAPRPPRGYSRVMRLLRNREFPMERTDAESLVAGAYDLERREVDAIVEYALETEEFGEESGQLVRS